MRRSARSLFVTILGACALLLLSVPAPAVAGVAAVSPLTAVGSGVDDFTFDSMHSELSLGRSATGHSTLTTTETIVARFPESDQNHGIRRSIPSRYDGHPTGVSVVSVTDETGAPRPSSTDTSDTDAGSFVVVTSAADAFVHGTQTYVITYTQLNVTLDPDNAADQEFYWEVNGTGWAQPFGSVSATVTVDPALTPRLTGRTACFQGGAAASAPCSELHTDTGTDAATATTGPATTVTASAGSLAAHEGLTVVVGFEPGTFVPRDSSFTATPFPGIGLAATLLGVLTAILAGVARATRWKNAPGRPTIIAEYLPPKGVTLLEAGDVTCTSAKAMTAQFLDFAVRGNVRVLEGEGSKHFLLELRHTDGVSAAELPVLAKLFPGLTPGMRRDLKTKDAALSTALQAELRSAARQSVASGLRERKGGARQGWLLAAAVVTAVVTVAAGILALADEVGGLWPVPILVVGVLASVLTLTLAGRIRPLTAAGAELRDYLEGVRLYIRVAEADRLRVLQSPQGALRSPYRPDAGPGVGPGVGTLEPGTVDVGQPLQVLRIYERLLPYAVLFGQEKEWSGVLGEYYTRSGSQPDWYYGPSAFNAVYFAVGVSGFASATSAAWSGSASSSSSSGFGGGGSVGGGGGGGGGGGV